MFETILFLLQKHHTRSGAQVIFYSTRTPERVSKRVNRLRRAADRSTPPIVEVKNEGSYTSTRPIWLLGSHKDNFTFLALMFVRVLVYSPTDNTVQKPL
jgi:hypothetical protein